MTPFEAAGYTKDDRFTVKGHKYFPDNTVVWLTHDDESTCPCFTDGVAEWHVDLNKLTMVKRTPCQELGYKVGDTFMAIDEVSPHYLFGDILELVEDDDSDVPRFYNKRSNKKTHACLSDLEKIPTEEEEVTSIYRQFVLDNLDNVDHPPHYNQGEIECIDAIRSMLGDEGFIAYCRGNAMKYTWRMMHKGKKKEDCEKAQWYLNKVNEVLNERGD